MIVGWAGEAHLDSGRHKGKSSSQPLVYGRIILHEVGMLPDGVSRKFGDEFAAPTVPLNFTINLTNTIST